MDRWSGRVALVTGASAGIGAAIAKMLAQAGLKVVACARRVELIEEASKNQPNIRAYKCDLSEDKQINDMFGWIEAQPDLGKVDVCVANAGLSVAASLMEGTPEQWRKMLNINVVALTLCTQLSLKSMAKNKIDDGQIILVNSMSGHRVVWSGRGHFYTASKYAVTGLLEGFRQEIRDMTPTNHIRIAQLSPGLVETEFVEVANLGDKEKAKETYSQLECLQAEDMAEHVRHILEMPKRVQINDIMVRPTQQRS